MAKLATLVWLVCFTTALGSLASTMTWGKYGSTSAGAHMTCWKVITFTQKDSDETSEMKLAVSCKGEDK